MPRRGGAGPRGLGPRAARQRGICARRTPPGRTAKPSGTEEMDALREYVKSLEQRIAHLQSMITGLGAETKTGDGGERL